MDPDANLREQRIIARRILEGVHEAGECERLAELVLALDEWIGRGGFIPNDWPRAREVRRV